MSIALGLGKPGMLERRAERRAPSPVAAALRRDRIAALALLAILAIVLVACLAPVLPLASPTKTNFGARLQPPFTPGHLLGTDQLGRDVLSRIVWGARVSLVVGALAAAIAAAAGSLVG